MNRLSLLLLILLAFVSLPWAALADEGYHAKFVITITIGDAFIDRMKKSGAKDIENITAADLEVQPVTGNTYFTRTAMRVDYVLTGTNMVITTLVDFERQKYILVNHPLRTAWEVDFASFKEMDQSIGIPISYPEQVFCRWQDIEDNIKAMPGAKVKRLGAKKVNAEDCQGLRFSVKLEDVFKADGYSPMSSITPVRDLKGDWLGEFWVSERFGLPVTMKMDMIGVEYNWDLSGIEEWNPIPALLQIPPGYKVLPLSATEMVKALSL